MRGSHAVALGILASTLCACQREPQQEPEERSAVLMKVEADPTISVSVSFAVGSQNDPAGKEGLAFLTGQMIADAATQNNTLDEILEKLYPLAAGYDVRVDRERTTLTGRTHRDNAEVYLSLFTDAFLRPAFTESDFERVKSDAINEIENTLRYSSDEELAKALLFKSAFQNTPYAHPPEGTAAGLRAVTLDDVRNFYREHYTQANALLGVGGGFDDSFVTALQQSLQQLPEGSRMAAPPITPQPLEGIQVTVIDKPRSDASISFGFPLDVHRGERDFYALWIANSWLGEHRSQASHLFQVIREIRGLNYGDYSYIEAYPEGGLRNMPPVNVPRRRQLFEVWIRTLPNEHAHFALRAAMRELKLLVDEGMTQEEFELTRTFLKKYVLHFADTTSMKLGYAVDDEFYNLLDEGHLQRFRRMMDELTLEDVNAAIKKHLQYENMQIAIVSGDAAALTQALVEDLPSPMTYETPKPPEVLDEDRDIAVFPLAIDDVVTIPIDDAFEN